MAKNKETSPLTIHVVLDRSGSMQIIKNDTIGGFNDYVAKIATDLPDSRLSLTIFDSQSIDTVIDDVKITKVKPLTGETYRPRAATPLYDSIGKVVQLLDKTKGKLKALVILTDGQENASHEYTREAVKKLIEERQKKGWLVTYLGANQDAFAESASIGVFAGNTTNFAANAAGTTNSFAAASASTARYAKSGGDVAFAGYTDAERDAAEDKGDKNGE